MRHPAGIRGQHADDIAIAKSLNLNVVAEGVETQSQLNFLRQQQCDAYQGYYFSKPLSVGELLELLNPAA